MKRTVRLLVMLAALVLPLAALVFGPTPAQPSNTILACDYPNWVAGAIVRYTNGLYYVADHGNPGYDPTRECEAAALLANVRHETGGLVHIVEQNTANYPHYCDRSQSYGCPAGQAAYHGRGPIQLSWNFKYKAAGRPGPGREPGVGVPAVHSDAGRNARQTTSPADPTWRRDRTVHSRAGRPVACRHSLRSLGVATASYRMTSPLRADRGRAGRWVPRQPVRWSPRG